MDLKVDEVSLNGTGVAVSHPLDPLMAEEIAAVTRILHEHFQWGADLRVETIDIHEPAKDVVRHYDPQNRSGARRPLQCVQERRDGGMAGAGRPG